MPPVAVHAAMSLVNSKVPEQRERGLALLEIGDFQQPDSIQVCTAALPPAHFSLHVYGCLHPLVWLLPSHGALV